MADPTMERLRDAEQDYGRVSAEPDESEFRDIGYTYGHLFGKAADLLESQAARIAELEAALRRIAETVGSPPHTEIAYRALSGTGREVSMAECKATRCPLPVACTLNKTCAILAGRRALASAEQRG